MNGSKEIDLTGIKCPMPIVHLTKIMRDIVCGDEIVVVASDPAFCVDVEAWCKRTGNELVDFSETDNQLVAKIRKRKSEGD